MLVSLALISGSKFSEPFFVLTMTWFHTGYYCLRIDPTMGTRRRTGTNVSAFTSSIP